MYTFPDLESICCSMSISSCCFLTCIQISQEAGKVVWYSHLFKNFPQFVVIHIVKRFRTDSETEVDIFLKFPCFLYECWQFDLWFLYLVKIQTKQFSVHVLLKPHLKDFEHNLNCMEDEYNCSRV